MHAFQQLKHYLFFSLVPIGSLIAQTPSGSTPEAISFPQALQRAIVSDPRLELNVTLAEAAEGQIEQADLPLNPVVGAEVENFLGTGPVSGVQGLEVTMGIRQVIETANKRERRTELARAERALFDWERESILAEVEASVRSAFVDVLLAQSLLRLREEQLVLAERSAAETLKWVEAARSPKVEQTRAQLAVRQQQFALQQAERELAAAKAGLASLWGDSEADDFAVVGKVQLETETPQFPDLTAKLINTAALARFSAEERAREAALDWEHASATPNFEVSAGGRYFNEADGNVGFIVGVELPWPLFDKNQGNIRVARARLSAVKHEREAMHQKLLIALNRAYQHILTAQAESLIIQNELLPAAEATLRETEAGYERGQFNQLAVLESRRTLFDVRETYLDALRRYVVAQAEIEALTRPAQINR
jgi:cobalt-zinc-cadmium efflux system outer membrane protein